ncbi:MAG: hypothetical protein QW680_12205 [Pyrobaculum sp.]
MRSCAEVVFLTCLLLNCSKSTLYSLPTAKDIELPPQSSTPRKVVYMLSRVIPSLIASCIDIYIGGSGHVSYFL